ncbi:hypothetical protein B0H21DRAFT_821326 [Amylocystis lapponica]|nr:hypothetical protein B0H21DRAFT_821326 [Amylocystis lapponica]
MRVHPYPFHEPPGSDHAHIAVPSPSPSSSSAFLRRTRSCIELARSSHIFARPASAFTLVVSCFLSSSALALPNCCPYPSMMIGNAGLAFATPTYPSNDGAPHVNATSPSATTHHITAVTIARRTPRRFSPPLITAATIARHRPIGVWFHSGQGKALDIDLTDFNAPIPRSLPSCHIPCKRLKILRKSAMMSLLNGGKIVLRIVLQVGGTQSRS